MRVPFENHETPCCPDGPAAAARFMNWLSCRIDRNLVVYDEIFRRRLAIPARNKFVLDFLSFTQTLQSGTLHSRDVHERVIRPVFRLDKSVTLRRVEPLHSSSSHRYSFHYIITTARLGRTAYLVTEMKLTYSSTQRPRHRPNAIKIKHDRSTYNLIKLSKYARLCRLMIVKKRDNLSISRWVKRFSPLIDDGFTVLDLAAGGGRHSVWLLDRGCFVTALDRNVESICALGANLDDKSDRLEIIEADLEDGSPWPLAERGFDAVLVVNYLWRPLFPFLIQAVAPGGFLFYDTFATGQEALGRPSDPDFLLKPGELLRLVDGTLAVVAYQHGLIRGEQGLAIKQCLVGRRPGGRHRGAIHDAAPAFCA